VEDEAGFFDFTLRRLASDFNLRRVRGVGSGGGGGAKMASELLSSEQLFIIDGDDSVDGCMPRISELRLRRLRSLRFGL